MGRGIGMRLTTEGWERKKEEGRTLWVMLGCAWVLLALYFTLLALWGGLEGITIFRARSCEDGEKGERREG